MTSRKETKFHAAQSAIERLGMRPMFGISRGHGNDIHLLKYVVEYNAMQTTAYSMPDSILDIVLDSKKFDRPLYATLVGMGLSIEACLMGSLS
jgi:hypothetical protein